MGDTILTIDGVEAKDRDSIGDLLQQGSGKKVFRLKRGDATVESTIDWSSETEEKERAERIARREAWMRAHPAR